ncbi:hypothetical protein [Paraburkholderia dioscoreae]|uniref:Uncharacterized protein n=1 Tax=Paraburkholderia dioscoreae TaxID=2604047 RepID=A0A5Q4ZB74_9BURK|nr:hypothetical protein [Paraburkholderia dioscoreae]VVD27445.1 conserved protein of unknown function [Paraburkholderia dioscoreae]
MKKKMPTLLYIPVSPDLADRAFNSANILLIIGAFLVFASTYVSIRAGSIRDFYSDQRRVENERQTAFAKAEAAEANEGAEVAKADAAQANASAETTRQSNLKLQIALEKERAERLQLEEKVAPRSLSDTERGAMQNQANKVCQRVRRVVVTAANSNNEAQRYGNEFIEIFRQAGCTADLALPIPGLEPGVLGVHIVVRDANHVPEQATLLASVLDAAHIAYETHTAKPDFFPEEQWVLVIGGKPLPSVK